MHLLKLNIIMTGLFIFALNANVIASTNHVVAAVIPFEDIHPMSSTNTSVGSTTPVNPATPNTTPNTTSIPSPDQNNLQLKATGSGGMGTSSSAANKTEQDDLYNQSVNKMINGN
jgi:hypothetical protein